MAAHDVDLPPPGIVVGGKRRRTGSSLVDVDPATGQVITEVDLADADDVAEAIDAARTAQPAWGALAPKARGRTLLAIADALRRSHERLARLESLDTGKPLSQARTDIEVAADYFEFYGGLADKLYGDAIPFEDAKLALTLLEPLGVTAHIVPWNYPLQISCRTVAPALAMGNACVLKPAEETPLTALALAGLVEEAGLPPGVLNIVPGEGEVAGAALSASDLVDHVSFTGGLETGRFVMGSAARHVKPVTLELGGKSPNIVFEDADLDRAAPVIVRAMLQNAGQTCSAGSRLLVADRRHDELVERITRILEGVRIGPGLDDPDLGPLISPAQRQRVEGFMARALDQGASLATDGGAGTSEAAAGSFVAPAVLVGVARDAEVAREEVFGPVLAVLPFGDEGDAVSLANDTPYGLVAGVWTGDVDRAFRVARAVQAGQVYVNGYGSGGGVALPFGGVRKSGFGREKGIEAAREYVAVKSVMFDVQR